MTVTVCQCRIPVNFMTHDGILSSAGRLIQIPGCQGTVCYPLGLQAPLQGPSGVDRGTCDRDSVPQLSMQDSFQFPAPWRNTFQCRPTHTDSRLSRGTVCYPLGLRKPLRGPSGATEVPVTVTVCPSQCRIPVNFMTHDGILSNVG